MCSAAWQKEYHPGDDGVCDHADDHEYNTYTISDGVYGMDKHGNTPLHNRSAEMMVFAIT